MSVRERLEQELAHIPERTVVRLPANYEAVYRSAIAALDQHLASREASPSRNAIRTLIEAVVVHGGNSRGGKHRRLELQGDLLRAAGVCGSVVWWLGGSSTPKASVILD